MDNEWLSREAKFQERDLRLAAAFAKEHADTFDSTFINSLQKNFDQKGFLSEKQYVALSNTIDKWFMDEWADREGFSFQVKA
jgi:hypothetical protein